MKSNVISGVFRGEGGEKMVTHLYSGDFDSPGFPYCSRGWHRKYFNKKGKLIDWEYSIFRNNISDVGICKVCQRRLEEGLPPIVKPSTKFNPKNRLHFK